MGKMHVEMQRRHFWQIKSKTGGEYHLAAKKMIADDTSIAFYHESKDRKPFSILYWDYVKVVKEMGIEEVPNG